MQHEATGEFMLVNPRFPMLFRPGKEWRGRSSFRLEQQDVAIRVMVGQAPKVLPRAGGVEIVLSKPAHRQNKSCGRNI